MHPNTPLYTLYTPYIHPIYALNTPLHGRYVILQVLLEAGEGLVEIKQIATEGGEEGEEGKGEGGMETYITIDASKIETVGKKVIGDFLNRLQVYKTTANAAEGKAMYDKYSHVGDDMLKMRDEVLARRKPRNLLVQPHVAAPSDLDAYGTPFGQHPGSQGSPGNEEGKEGKKGKKEGSDDDSEPILVTFPATLEGVIDSFMARFADEAATLELRELAADNMDRW